MAHATFPRAVAMAALQASLTGVWVAAGELSPARRRLARLGLASVVGGIGYAFSRSASSSSSSSEAEPELVVGKRPMLVSEGGPVVDPDQFPPVEFDKRKAALAAGIVGVSAAAMYGRRRLRRHWLHRLTRDGHPHPARALAVRMAAVDFAGQLALELVNKRQPSSS